MSKLVSVMKRIRPNPRHRDALNEAIYTAPDYASTVTAVYKAVWWNATANTAPDSDTVRCIAALADFIAECPESAMTEANLRAREVIGDDAAEVTVHEGIVTVAIDGDAVAWSTVNEAVREATCAHPLGPIIDAWQEAYPPSVKPKIRNDSIYPGRLVLSDREDPRTGRLFSPSFYENTAGGVTAYLPGLGLEYVDHAPSLPLAFYYAGGRPGSGSGRAAPVALRLWLEIIFASRLQYGGRSQQFEIEQSDLLNWLYPNGWRRGGRSVAAVIDACRALDEMRIPIDYDGRGLVAWRVVGVDGRPLQHGAPVVCTVKLPPGSERGPVIDREALRRYGMESAVLHRGMLNVAFRLHHPGRTSRPVRSGKKFVPVKDPARYGERLLTTDGNPIHHRAAHEIVRLFYPGDTSRGNTFAQHLHRAIEALRRLENDAHLRIDDGRIMSPEMKRKLGDGDGG